MLHDLYLLSCYFDPLSALQYEDELATRYGSDIVSTALKNGLLERICAPCAQGSGRFFCRLSASGHRYAQAAVA